MNLRSTSGQRIKATYWGVIIVITHLLPFSNLKAESPLDIYICVDISGSISDTLMENIVFNDILCENFKCLNSEKQKNDRVSIIGFGSEARPLYTELTNVQDFHIQSALKDFKDSLKVKWKTLRNQTNFLKLFYFMDAFVEEDLDVISHERRRVAFIISDGDSDPDSDELEIERRLKKVSELGSGIETKFCEIVAIMLPDVKTPNATLWRNTMQRCQGQFISMKDNKKKKSFNDQLKKLFGELRKEKRIKFFQRKDKKSLIAVFDEHMVGKIELLVQSNYEEQVYLKPNENIKVKFRDPELRDNVTIMVTNSIEIPGTHSSAIIRAVELHFIISRQLDVYLRSKNFPKDSTDHFNVELNFDKTPYKISTPNSDFMLAFKRPLYLAKSNKIPNVIYHVDWQLFGWQLFRRKINTYPIDIFHSKALSDTITFECTSIDPAIIDALQYLSGKGSTSIKPLLIDSLWIFYGNGTKVEDNRVVINSKSEETKIRAGFTIEPNRVYPFYGGALQLSGNKRTELMFENLNNKRFHPILIYQIQGFGLLTLLILCGTLILLLPAREKPSLLTRMKCTIYGSTAAVPGNMIHPFRLLKGFDENQDPSRKLFDFFAFLFSIIFTFGWTFNYDIETLWGKQPILTNFPINIFFAFLFLIIAVSIPIIIASVIFRFKQESTKYKIVTKGLAIEFALTIILFILEFGAKLFRLFI